MSLRQYFKSNGGFNLIKQYAKDHILFYAFIVFLIVPKNKKGLELFRECINCKLYFKLKKKYKNKAQKYEVSFLEKNNKIWFCWFQGFENSPPIVKACLDSIKRNFTGYEIEIITSENFQNFTDIPNFILEKWKKGIISNAHFSDILRTNLLINNGGIWIDSTVFITKKLPDEIYNSDFFLFQTLKPGSDGMAVPISSWFIFSKAEYPILKSCQDMIYEYWKNENYLCDYFLFHIFLQVSIEMYPDLNTKIPKYTNENPHILLFNLNNQYEKSFFKNIANKSFLHKLTYKLDDVCKENKDNIYNAIITNTYEI